MLYKLKKIQNQEKLIDLYSLDIPLVVKFLRLKTLTNFKLLLLLCQCLLFIVF